MGLIEYYAIGSLATFIVLMGIIFGDGTIRLLLKKYDYRLAMVISLSICSIIWPLSFRYMLKPEELRQRITDLLEEKGNE